MSFSGTLQTEIAQHVATITFGHPASNSFPGTLLHELSEAIKTLSHFDDISVVVLQSEGNGAFCAGASFDELLGVTNLVEGTQFFSGFANVLNAMRKCSKLIVGRIQGKAVGGGVGLAAACDYTFATQYSAVKLSELAIGIGPFVIEPAVSRKIGKTAFAEISLTPNDWKSAKWAQEKGLFSQVAETVETMDEALIQFVDNLASFNPEAMADLKKVLWEGTENWDSLLYERASISGKLVLSDFTKNALENFKK